MEIYSIYKATNTMNGKSYIGFAKDLNNRKRCHKHKAFKKNSQQMFHKALRKYGWEAFSWETLYQSTDQKHTIQVMEPYFISEHNTREYGYNMTDGGEGTFGVIVSEEKKSRQSQIMSGNDYARNLKHSETHKNWLKTHYTGETNPMYGKTHSTETKNKIREKAIGRKWSDEQKKIRSEKMKRYWESRKAVA